MGLFAPRASSSVAAGKKVLGRALFDFNQVIGRCYFTRIELKKAGLVECCRAFDRIAKLGFPDQPGPFKRMAGFAVLSQQFDLWDIQCTDPSDKILWRPRIALYSLPAIAEAIVINEHSRLLKAFDMPTRHFQVEFIGLLRGYSLGKKKSTPSDFLLFERINAVGLILESAAYASLAKPEMHQLVRKGAKQCVSSILEDIDFQDDMIFNDQDAVVKVLGCPPDELGSYSE